MANEKGRNKTKRERKKIERSRLLLGVDLCACGCGNKLRCHGICREKHTKSSTGNVECGEVYRINCPDTKSSGSRRPRRTWKYGRQKEGNENKLDKQHRREKMERDRS